MTDHYLSIRYFSIALLICACTIGAFAQSTTDCVSLRDDEKTREFYFATIQFREPKPLKTVKGTVRFGSEHGDPQEDVFVEVLEQQRSSAGNQKRVAGCKTDATGRFEFANLKKGKYIVRLSKSGGYQLTEILISVSPTSKNTEPITALIEVGH